MIMSITKSKTNYEKQVSKPEVDIDALRDILDEAIAALHEERDQLLKEKQAFKRFAKRLRKLDAVDGSPEGLHPTNTSPVDYGSDSDRLHNSKLASAASTIAAVRTAYVETILDLSHYDDVFDESLRENLAGEFGAEIATAIENSPVLYPQLKQWLLEGTTNAIDSREELLDPVESEIDALTAAKKEILNLAEELRSVLNQPIRQMEFNALQISRQRLKSVRSRCDDFAMRRQEQLQRQWQQLTLVEAGYLEKYLYHDCMSLHPVLSALTRLCELVESGIDLIDRSLVRTV